MASVTQVRSLINLAIGSELGTYTLPDGSTIPALWVRGSQQVPKDWSIDGIECVIDEVPEIRNAPTVSQATIFYTKWPVSITSYDVDTTLNTVRELLFRWFPDIEDPTHVSQTDISYETLKVFIPDYSLKPELGINYG